MQNFNSGSFSKANIKNRLLQRAAELWGYNESEMDSFDPLVGLLIEACSVEFEKVANEINATQHRLLERLAGLMNPDVVDSPRPAHAIAQARSKEPVTLLPTDMQFTYQRLSLSRNAALQPVFFSPLQPTKLTDGAIRYLANENTIWRIEGGMQKQVAAVSTRIEPAEHRSLWIGLELNTSVHVLSDLTFYFDWPNDPLRDSYFQYLPGESWHLGDQVLSVARGFPSSESKSAADQLLHQEFDYLKRMEHTIRSVYEKRFVRVRTTYPGENWNYSPQLYPLALEQRFSPKDLQAFSKPLVWLEVRFSNALPVEALSSAFCAINCFPVLNRRINKVLYRLQQSLNIFPLETEEAFLAIKEVYSLSSVVYQPTSLAGLEQGATDTYTLRHQGVGRFDSRDAKEALLELLELLRDESRAFAAAGTDFVSSVLRELNQNLARLEERIYKDTKAKSPVPYIVLRPQDVNDSVYAEYWSTDGEAGNKIPAGSRLQVYDSYYLENVVLLTTTAGGRDQPRSEERVFAFKKNLLSRNRIVTLEDIKAACWAELGNRIAKVHVEKGFLPGNSPHSGFIRCIQVKLTPAPSTRKSPEEWKRALEELQAVLENQSAMNLPYQLSLDQPPVVFG